MFSLDLRYIILPEGPIPPLDQLHKRATPCRSFVFNFLGAFWVQVRAVSQILIDIGGVSRVCAIENDNLKSTGGAGSTIYGIQVGTGLLLPTASDYKLGAIITHGNAAGQLMYAGQAFVDPYTVDTITYAALRRNFTNQGANPITINEIGWVMMISYTTAFGTFLVARDLIPGGSLVAVGTSKQVVYTLATEV